jgi:hypothetical protein
MITRKIITTVDVIEIYKKYGSSPNKNILYRLYSCKRQKIP